MGFLEEQVIWNIERQEMIDEAWKRKRGQLERGKSDELTTKELMVISFGVAVLILMALYITK